METKAFATWQVLSVTTGRLLGEIGGVYEILNWMTGESLMTHQLPRVGREAEPAILAMHPHLAEANTEAEQVTGDNWREWLAKWVDRYGDEIAVPKLTTDQHERIDPISEAAERFRPDQMIVVNPTALQPEGEGR